MAQLEELLEVVGQSWILLTLGQQVEVLRDEGAAAAQQKSDLAGLEVAGGQLCTAGEGGKVIGHGRRGVAEYAANLRGGLAFQGQADDLHAGGEDRTDITRLRRGRGGGGFWSRSPAKSREMVRGLTKKMR